MIVQVSKWGNSLGVCIPKAIATQARLVEGSRVDLRLEDGNLFLMPVAVPSYTLEFLMEGITPENCHGEIATGKPMGREVL